MSDWWREAVCYQIYPRSFADSDGDGIGDLPGVIAHLDHLEWLGIDGIWLVADVPVAERRLGLRRRRLLRRASRARHARRPRAADRRGRRARHPRAARPRAQPHEHRASVVRGRRAHRGTRSIATGTCGPTRSRTAAPPNNWVSAFLGPGVDATTRRPGSTYLTNFLPEQADLNWWNDEVRDEFDRILRYWFDRGVAGFRIDVAHMIVKDRELRDNPPASASTTRSWRSCAASVSEYNSNRPRCTTCTGAGGASPTSTTRTGCSSARRSSTASSRSSRFYGDGDELGLAFHIPFMQAPFDADALRDARRRDRAAPARRLHPGVDAAATTTCRGCRRGGRRATPPRARCALLTAAHAARHARSSTTATRSGCPTPTIPLDRLVDPVEQGTRTGAQPRRRAHADGVDGRLRRRVHRSGRRAVAPVR